MFATSSYPVAPRPVDVWGAWPRPVPEASRRAHGRRVHPIPEGLSFTHTFLAFQRGVSSGLEDDQGATWEATTRHETDSRRPGLLDSARIHSWQPGSLRVLPPIADDPVRSRG